MTAEEIKTRMSNDRNFTAKALLFLYSRQTDSEKNSKATNTNNGVGFNSADSDFLSRLAQWYQTHKFFTDKQYYSVLKKMNKYANQLSKGGFNG